MTSEMVSFVGWTSISRLRDGASVAYWVHTPEMGGFDSPSRYQQISWHDKIEEINASAMGVDDHYDKLDNLCLSY